MISPHCLHARLSTRSAGPATGTADQPHLKMAGADWPPIRPSIERILSVGETCRLQERSAIAYLIEAASAATTGGRRHRSSHRRSPSRVQVSCDPLNGYLGAVTYLKSVDLAMRGENGGSGLVEQLAA